MLRLKERKFSKKIVQSSRSRQLNRDWGAPVNSGFRCATSDWSSVLVCRGNLRLELVHKHHKTVIILLNDQSSILPYSVFGVMSASDRIALILMNIMNTMRTAAMSAAVS